MSVEFEEIDLFGEKIDSQTDATKARKALTGPEMLTKMDLLAKDTEKISEELMLWHGIKFYKPMQLQIESIQQILGWILRDIKGRRTFLKQCLEDNHARHRRSS